jgi:hypothetical protein
MNEITFTVREIVARISYFPILNSINIINYKFL